jgi:hypothetical protein
MSAATVTITVTAARWAAIEELMTAATIVIRKFDAPLGPRPPALDAGAHP